MKIIISASRNFCKLETEVDVIEPSECKALLEQLYTTLIDVFPDGDKIPDDRPSQKQIDYAVSLGIQNPQNMTKEELRSQIAKRRNY